MIRNVLAATAVAVMAGSALGADFLFPSANPPGGKSASEVPQFISFIWDDNGYSGEMGTEYEYKAGNIPWTNRSTVGGSAYTGGQFDPSDQLRIGRDQMGLAWAVNTLGEKMKRTGKGTGHMTFNMISGLFVETTGSNWYDRKSKYGFFNNGTTTSDAGQTVPWNIASANGREGRIFNDAGVETHKPFMIDAMKNLRNKGHEIGNHTIDHIETNSKYNLKRPDGSNLWPNNGEGFDDGTTGVDALGNAWIESEEFSGSSEAEQQMGWLSEIGRVLSVEGWAGIIDLGEEDGIEQNIYTKADLHGFRAPRLEINSAMFTALAQADYLYDCGVEEGMEAHVDGTNFLWPYTVDNGIPNFYTQTQNGETIRATSFPTTADDGALWEIPVNLMIVPEAIRENVLAGHNVLRTQGEGNEPLAMEHWDGKITGFDFNMFVLWAMLPSEVEATMKHSLDLRMEGLPGKPGNRAPMQIGSHSDYFTPIYDIVTIPADAAFRYALPEHNPGHGNTWDQRKSTFENFVDYAGRKDGVQFVSGVELINGIKQLQAGEIFGQEYAVPATATWNFLADDVASEDLANASTFSGGGFNGKIKLNTSDNAAKQYAYSSYYAEVEEGSLNGLTHLSMNYNTNSTIKVRMYVKDDFVIENGVTQTHEAAWEVILNNIEKDVFSGKIPVSAFQYGPYSQGGLDAIDLSKVHRIEIAPLSQGEENIFAISDIKTYGAEVITVDHGSPIQTGMSNGNISNLAVHSISNNVLNLSVPTAGNYSVALYSTAGRLVSSYNNANLTAGVNPVELGSISAGVYMLQVMGEMGNLTTKAVIQ